MSETRAHLACRWVPMHIARAYLDAHHRHLPRVTGAIIALACYDLAGGGSRLCGVAFLGRPVARLGDGGMERSDVLRVATDGTPNAGSALYGRCRRVSAVLGLLPPTTYTLPHESGASLRGAGYIDEGMTEGGDWPRAGRTSKSLGDGVRGPKRRWRAADRERG